MNWISVKDRLPENGQRVMIYNGIEIMDGFNWWKEDDIFQNDYDQEFKKQEVTHWMKLPDPPL
jgi:hypothetical protein